VLWVDDIAIISATVEGVNRVKQRFADKFEVRDLGELSEYLGLNITRDREQCHLYLTQHT
jgi:hypothetical protein